MRAKVEGSPRRPWKRTVPLTPEMILRNIKRTWDWHDSFLHAVETGDFSSHPNYSLEQYKDPRTVIRVANSQSHARERFETIVKPALLDLREKTVAGLVDEVDRKFEAAVSAKGRLEEICLATELTPGVTISPALPASIEPVTPQHTADKSEPAQRIKLPYRLDNALKNPNLITSVAILLLVRYKTVDGISMLDMKRDLFQVAASFISVPEKDQLREYASKEVRPEARQPFLEIVLEEALRRMQLGIGGKGRYAAIDRAAFEAAVRDHFATIDVSDIELKAKQVMPEEQQPKAGNGHLPGAEGGVVVVFERVAPPVAASVDMRDLKAKDLPADHPLKPVWDKLDRDERLIASLIPIHGKGENTSISTAELQERTRGLLTKTFDDAIRSIKEKTKLISGVDLSNLNLDRRHGKFASYCFEVAAPAKPLPKRKETRAGRQGERKVARIFEELKRRQGQRTLSTTEVIAMTGVKGENFKEQSDAARQYIYRAYDLAIQENLAVVNMARVKAEGEYALVAFPQEVLALMAAEKQMREEDDGRYTIVQKLMGKGFVTHRSVYQNTPRGDLFSAKQQAVYHQICLARVHRPVTESTLCKHLYPGKEETWAKPKLTFIINQLDGILAAEGTTIINREDIFPTDGEPKYCIVPIDETTTAIIGKTQTSPDLVPAR